MCLQQSSWCTGTGHTTATLHESEMCCYHMICATRWFQIYAHASMLLASIELFLGFLYSRLMTYDNKCSQWRTLCSGWLLDLCHTTACRSYKYRSLHPSAVESINPTISKSKSSTHHLAFGIMLIVNFLKIILPSISPQRLWVMTYQSSVANQSTCSPSAYPSGPCFLILSCVSRSMW